MGFSYNDVVMPYDTDYQGVAHYSSYYRFVTNALSAFSEKKLRRILEKHPNLWFVIVESHARYLKPLYLYDKIRVVVEPGIVENKKIVANFKIYKKGVLTTEGYLMQMLVDKRKWRSVEIPKDVLDALK